MKFKLGMGMRILGLIVLAGGVSSAAAQGPKRKTVPPGVLNCFPAQVRDAGINFKLERPTAKTAPDYRVHVRTISGWGSGKDLGSERVTLKRITPEAGVQAALCRLVASNHPDGTDSKAAKLVLSVEITPIGPETEVLSAKLFTGIASYVVEGKDIVEPFRDLRCQALGGLSPEDLCKLP